MRDEGRGVRVEGERLSVKDEGSGGELGSDLNLDPDPWKILWIRIRQYDADPLNPDPQHCFNLFFMEYFLCYYELQHSKEFLKH